MSDRKFKRCSMVSVHCADSDIERTYPAVQITINGSKETTIRELVAVEGLGYEGLREHGFNLIGGAVNSTRFCIKVFRLPTPDQMLESFLESN